MSSNSLSGIAELLASYRDRGAAASEHALRLQQEERWLSHSRLAAFLLVVALGWFAFGSRQISGLWLIPPALAFGVLLILHDQVIQRRMHCERRSEFYRRGTSRVEGQWSGEGVTGEIYRDPKHPYADDLDLFGRGSLFELLCTARSPVGEATLARWLLSAAPPDEVIERQRAVEELRSRLDLREDLALLGEDVRSRLDPAAMLHWGAAASAGLHPRLRFLARGCVLLSLIAIAGYFAKWWPGWPIVASLGLQIAVAVSLRGRVSPVLRDVERPLRDIRLLQGLLARMEREEVDSKRLGELRLALDTGGVPPSERIAKLQRLVDLLDARKNQLFAPISGLLLWGTQIAIEIEAWRKSCGLALEPWLNAAGEFDALAALAGYASEHPSDPFPEIVPGEPLYEAEGLGHPLLPELMCVRNDLHLGAALQAHVVSGSNMSGKSTLLRSVGVNAVLAFAGAPVRAQGLRLSPLAVAASIRVNDSLQEGRSRFYAEIERLHQIVQLCDGERPVIFLLDEILHGTNSHDRRIGASAVVRGLVERGAIGLVTTHDLALARIVDELPAKIENVHFEDHMEAGEIAFDYRLKPGIVEKSNAIELMRAVGLEV